MDDRWDQAPVNQLKKLSATSAGGGQTLRRLPGTLASGHSPFCEIPSFRVWMGPGTNLEPMWTMRKPLGCHAHDQAIKDWNFSLCLLSLQAWITWPRWRGLWGQQPAGYRGPQPRGLQGTEFCRHLWELRSGFFPSRAFRWHCSPAQHLD